MNPAATAATFFIEVIGAVGGFVINVVGDTGSLGVSLVQAVAHVFGG